MKLWYVNATFADIASDKMKFIIMAVVGADDEDEALSIITPLRGHKKEPLEKQIRCIGTALEGMKKGILLVNRQTY